MPKSVDAGTSFAKLPVMIPIEGLEPGCARKVFLGIKLPESVGAEEDTAAFMLAEQVGVDGEADWG
jgi:hypothetical protein